MKRRQLVELEDLAWWPRTFRDAATDYLATAIRVAKAHTAIAPVLATALAQARATRIVDLCSGGGGPWAGLLPALRDAGLEVGVTLTDRYPNIEALRAAAAATPGIEVETRPVDALAVPADLHGFRTIFTALHHFPPDEATVILASAVAAGDGIAVFEGASRTPGGVAVMAAAPLGVWLLTPLVRPFRLSRLFWTYLVPVLPAAILFDGVVSALRTYAPDELLAMARAADPAAAFEWHSGLLQPPGAPIGVPYLAGVPRSARPACSAEVERARR